MFTIFVLLIVSILLNFLFLLTGMKVISRRGGIRYLRMIASNKLKQRPLPVVTNQSKIGQYMKYRTSQEDIVFLGDSITENGKWSEFFPEKSCRNRGIGGEETKHLLSRLDSVIVGHPQKIFLLIGINDLIAKVPYDGQALLNNYKAILKEIRVNSCGTTVYVQSILPINTQMCKDILSRKVNMVFAITNDDIARINRSIQALCDEMGITFIDHFSTLLDNARELDALYSMDGLHISFDGYLKLSENLEPFVLEDAYRQAVKM